MPVEYCLRKMVEAECAEAQIKTQVVLEMTSPEGILQAVAEGAGLTIPPELYVRLRLAGSGARIIDLYDPAPCHSVGLAYRGNRYQNIAARDGTSVERP
jgi:DNA-binding transcriptional LysR family regulator